MKGVTHLISTQWSQKRRPHGSPELLITVQRIFSRIVFRRHWWQKVGASARSLKEGSSPGGTLASFAFSLPFPFPAAFALPLPLPLPLPGPGVFCTGSMPGVPSDADS